MVRKKEEVMINEEKLIEVCNKVGLSVTCVKGSEPTPEELEKIEKLDMIVMGVEEAHKNAGNGDSSRVFKAENRGTEESSSVPFHFIE